MVGHQQVLLAAIKSVVSATLLFLWATGLALSGMVDQAFVSSLSRIAKVMFVPCLTFDAVAGGVTYPFLRENWILVVHGVLTLVVGSVLGHMLAQLSGVPKDMKPWFVLSVAVPNMIALPLILVEALCHEEVELDDVGHCVSGATTRLFATSLTHTFGIWIFGVAYVQANTSTGGNSTSNKGIPLPENPDLPGASQTEQHRIGLHRAAERGRKSGSDAEKAVLKDAGPTANTKENVAAVRATTLGIRVANETAVTDTADGGTGSTDAKQPVPLAMTVCKSFLEPPVLANLFALAVVFVPSVHTALYTTAAPLSFVASSIAVMAKASPGITNLIAGATLGLQLKNLGRNDPLGLQELGMSARALVLLVVSRVIIVPTVLLVLMFVFSSWLPRDPWSRLILFFQPAGVTANVITLLAQVLDNPRGARLTAVTAVPQLLLYVPAATAFIALGIAVNGEQLS